MLAKKTKSTGAFRAITLLIIMMGIFLSSLSFVLADLQFQRDREIRTQEVNSLNLNQALSLAQNVNRSFAQADTILQLLKTEMETDKTLNASYVRLIKEFLKPGIFNQIAVSDSMGNLIFSAIPRPLTHPERSK